MTSTHRPVGIAVGPTDLVAVAAAGTTAAPGASSVALTVDQHGDRLGIGPAPGSADATARVDVLDRLGERGLIPFLDSYYEAVDVLALLLGALRSDAEQLAGGVPDAASIAHPASWDPRRRGLLVRAARGAGFTDVELVTAPEAALYAPAHGHHPATDGLLLVLHLDRPGGADLLEPDGDGYRVVGSAVISGQGRIRPIVDELLAVAGRGLSDVRDVRAFGRGAVDRVRVAGIENEVGETVLVAERAVDAVAVGALHRWIGRRVPAPRARPTPPRLPPDADITQLLAQHALDREARGDPATAERARHLAQEIYQFRLRIHPPAPPGTEAAVLREAQALVAATPGGS